MPLGMEVGLGPGDIVLDGDPASPPPQRGRHSLLQFLTHVCCGQTVVHLSYCSAEHLFCVYFVHLFWLVNACFCCVRFCFSIPSQEIGLVTSPKWPILC